MTALLNPFWHAAAVATDPYFASVVLLMHFDGANGSNSFVDSSMYTHPITASATTVNTTAQQKFGAASLQNAATNTDAHTADSDDWNFAAGQFTVEAWVRPTSPLLGAGFQFIVGSYAGIGQRAWALRFNGSASGSMEFAYSVDAVNPIIVSAAYLPPTNVWTHIAADRDASNVLRTYANGVVMGSATAAATFFSGTVNLTIANSGSATGGFIGQIDELRITKGVARYAGAFAPPTAPFPDA